ncbi:hypothetical protein OHC33_004104 [Knufia fluminis]|uniref:F-box domain-containing protein n=1 Tax=Knufia fluminis TaxID=191047 RepID=A0AAN8INP8_9EURO|nr:hypothetical protein OHC33_004104 [Knufia fluminis]
MASPSSSSELDQFRQEWQQELNSRRQDEGSPHLDDTNTPSEETLPEPDPIFRILDLPIELQTMIFSSMADEDPWTLIKAASIRLIWRDEITSIIWRKIVRGNEQIWKPVLKELIRGHRNTASTTSEASQISGQQNLKFRSLPSELREQVMDDIAESDDPWDIVNATAVCQEWLDNLFKIIWREVRSGSGLRWRTVVEELVIQRSRSLDRK